MTEFTDAAWIWLAKGVGAVAGSAISLAYILPHGRREAGLRFAVGTVCGLVFGGAAGIKIAAELGIGDEIAATEMVLMGAAAASLCAWWALGFVFRAFERGGAGRKFWQAEDGKHALERNRPDRGETREDADGR